MAALLLEPLAARLLLRNLMPMLLLSILLTAALLFFAIDHPQGFPWLTALVTRFIAVWTAGSLTSLIPGQQPVPTAYCLVMTLGGVRGAVTLALALSLPVAAGRLVDSPVGRLWRGPVFSVCASAAVRTAAGNVTPAWAPVATCRRSPCAAIAAPRPARRAPGAGTRAPRPRRCPGCASASGRC